MTRSHPGGHYDVIVVGSGFGGSVAALRLTEKGYRVGVLEAGRRFADDEFAATSWRLRKFLWAPRLGLLRHPAHPPAARRRHPRRRRGGRRVAESTPTPCTCRRRSSSGDPQWAGITDWARELAPLLRPGAPACSASPMCPTARRWTTCSRGGAGHGRRAHLPAHPGRGVLRRTGRRHRAGPVFRRGGPAAYRLPGMRRMHDRLPAQREEHAAEELPRPGRGGRRGRPPDDHGAPRSARALRRVRGRDGRAPDRCVARAPDLHRRARRAGRRHLQHPAAAAPDARRRHACRACPPGSGTSPGRTPSHSSARSPRAATIDYSRASRSPRRSTRTRTPTSNRCATARAAT